MRTAPTVEAGETLIIHSDKLMLVEVDGVIYAATIDHKGQRWPMSEDTINSLLGTVADESMKQVGVTPQIDATIREIKWALTSNGYNPDTVGITVMYATDDEWEVTIGVEKANFITAYQGSNQQ